MCVMFTAVRVTFFLQILKILDGLELDADGSSESILTCFEQGLVALSECGLDFLEVLN